MFQTKVFILFLDWNKTLSWLVAHWPIIIGFTHSRTRFPVIDRHLTSGRWCGGPKEDEEPLTVADAI